MKKQWVRKEPVDNEIVDRLANELKLDRTLASLLVQRGITTAEGANSFFNPQLSQLHDPFLMKDMDKAVERIHRALQNKERILVFGDYDVDGTTAVAVMFSFLSKQPGVDMGDLNTRQIEYRIPDRYSDGYGLNETTVEYAKKHNFTLIITLDCGIKANKEIDIANSLGIDVIVGDHHRSGDTIPAGYAVLDPKRPDCEYPYNHLSGCGISFKIIQAYCRRYGIPETEIYDYLDMVVVSIASDVVPITDENRILAYYGLKQINTKPRPAFESILKYSNVVKSGKGNPNMYFNRELTITDLVFLIGPRINAAGRMESGKNAVRLLLADSLERSEIFAKEIDEYNKERKVLDSKATEEALAHFDSGKISDTAKTTVVYDPSWHKGVIGIVASRLTESYYRPTIVFTKSGDLITGSARSVGKFDIYSAIETCSDLIEHWGGHKYAAGLSIKEENFDAFCQKFEQAAAKQLTEESLVPKVQIDAEIDFCVITRTFFDNLKKFAPFGTKNPNPTFETRDVVDGGSSKIVGQKHLKLSLIQNNKQSYLIDGIAFQQADQEVLIKSGKPFNIAYQLEENEWNGKVSIQLNVKDIQE
ncbi:MAG: single-stranded-DNA-specific exonuclease RecJ [Bacteroidales bacterium]|jgi:single-stranded-DNA-specific exonuclease|nr:single-stranded-DNA-specific exonuclease RecJ [Bacteroidales bacterium]